MNILLVYLALPVATILLSIVLEKILRSPLLVGITAFAIYLIVTFSAFDINFLIFAISYSALAYITALTTMVICRIERDSRMNNGIRMENDFVNNSVGCNSIRRPCERLENTVPTNFNNPINGCNCRRS